MNLADPKRLSIAGLEGLARLLKLLTNYFKVEIGSKLLDHFRIIADAEMLKKASRGPLCDNDEITKLVRLVNIFHLLPSAANVFLPELVNVVVQTEAQLHSTSASPFSEPLGKFLDRYPTESVDLFFRYVNMPRFIRTLRNILQADLAPLVLRELGARPHDIIEKCFHSISSNSASYVLPGLLLCHDLATLIPNWTAANGEIIDTILSLWRSYAVQPADNGGSTPAEYARIHKMMVKILIKAMEESPRIDILFEIVAAFSRPIAIDWSGLGRFLYQHVALNGSALFRRNILTRFVVWFDDKSYPWHYKTYFLRYIITPMILVHTMQRRDDEVLLDRYILAAFHEKIWKRLGDKSFKEAGDLLIIEILHLTTVMLHHCSQLLVDAKKDIIMYVWPFISNEDTVVKQTANLLAARFFEAFESPPKLILTAWTGLLKPPHAEVRTLVKQALDILSSVLPVRMPKEPGHPHWAKTTRRLLAEEAHGMSQIQVIYQLIVRQPDLFYPCRDLFMPHMVNSLGKLGLQPTATPESRSLSLDVLSLIFGWEQKAINSGEPQIWVTPLAFRETMVSYLVRLATAMSDQNARNVLIPRALTLLKDFLSTPGWSDVSFKLDFFRKALDQVCRFNDLQPTITQ
jgi:transformation/transcription domain-associated protein